MNKKFSIVLLILFATIFVFGIFLLIPEPVTMISYEKSVFCRDGICEISAMRTFSDGSAAGTSSTIPQDWYDGTEEVQYCENGFWVTRTTERKNGVIIGVASSISTENKCPR